MEKFQNTGQPDWDWWGRLWTAPGETLRDLGLSSGDTVAEVGSGNGYFAIPAARIAEPATVYAVDIEASLLEEARELAGMNGVENLVTVEGDASSLSDHLNEENAEEVDFALVANIFHGVDDRGGLVREVRDVLSHDGRFVVMNWYDLPSEETTVAGKERGPPTELRMGPDETEEAVVSEGFEAVEVVELPPYHYAVVFEKAS